MPNYYAQIQQPEIRNALLDLSPVNNALEGVRDQNNANRNALLQQSQLDMRKEEQTYQRGRDQKQDAWQQVQRAGAEASAIQQMPDTDPAKPYAWQNYVKKHGDGNHSPEELDFRTGPAIAAAAAGKYFDPRDSRMKDLEIQKTEAQIRQANQRSEDPVMNVDGNLVRVPRGGGPAVEIYSGKPKMTPAQTALDKTYAKSYEEDIVSGGLADAQKNLNQLKNVNSQLQDPKGANLTGPLIGRLPDFLGAFMAPKAVDARERVEEVVQRNLRLVLGAQFTNEEGKRLIARAYNPALDEATNASRLTNLIGAMDQAIQAKQAAARYYEQNGTLQGYQGRTNFSVSDFENAIDGGAPAASSGQANSLKSKYGLE